MIVFGGNLEAERKACLFFKGGEKKRRKLQKGLVNIFATMSILKLTLLSQERCR